MRIKLDNIWNLGLFLSSAPDEGHWGVGDHYYDCVLVSAAELILSKHWLLVMDIPNAGRKGLMPLSVILYLSFTSNK